MENIFSSKENSDTFNYLKVLKSLNEIPFPIGKTTLISFLAGDSKHPSVQKNNLSEKINFGSLKKDKEEIREIVDDLIRHRFIEVNGTLSNPFMKLLSITTKGNQELMNPKYYLTKNKLPTLEKFEITTEEIYEFQEFDKFLEGFNENQKKAIISKNKNTMCIAGAGSGKTSVLTKRVEFLIKHRGVNPKKILAITFTRKARQEMKRRLEKAETKTNVETFNSFGEAILRKYETQIYGRQTKLITSQDKIRLVREALEEQKKTFLEAINEYFTPLQRVNKSSEKLLWTFINDCFNIIDYFKYKNIRLYDFSKDAETKHYLASLMVYRTCNYIKNSLEIEGLRDYSDQLIDSLKFLKRNPDKIPQFEHILVDEYQDLNSMQVDLIETLNPQNLFGVGDPRQSIFGWRGSEISHITNFEKNKQDSEVIPLTINYRSPQKIVNFMNESIKHMKFPNLQASKSALNEKITIEEFTTEMEEMLTIIQKILESKNERHEIFILSRTNKQLVEISKLMSSMKIPHIIKTEDENTNIDSEEGSITLATIHSIKGLQAKEVFILGCNTQNFPCKASDHPVIEMIKMEDYDKDEEEKRLFYVAISRAKERLYISYTGTKTDFITDEMIKMSKS